MMLLAVIPCVAFADDIPIEKVTIDDLPDELVIDTKYTFHFTVYPENATYEYLTFEVSDERLAALSDTYYSPFSFYDGIGLQTKVATGECTINILSPDDIVVGSKTVKITLGGKRFSTNPIKTLSQTYIDNDYTSQNIDVSQVDWNDTVAVTNFMKKNVSGIKDEYRFQMYRSNTDFKGFTHYDCKQVDRISGNDIFGSELIAHVDKDNKLIYITGSLAEELSDQEETDSKYFYVEHEQTYDINESQFTQKADLSGDLYYYKKDHITAEKGFAGATDGNGTYVLQDPGRLYTLDYTNGPKVYNWSNSTLSSLLYSTRNFTSTSPTFSEGYNGMESEIKSISCKIKESMTSEQSVNLEIRKCNVKDAANDDWENAWSKGTTCVTSTSEVDENGSAEFAIDNIKMSMPCRQVIEEPTIENVLYVAKVSDSKNVLISEPVMVQHSGSFDLLHITHQVNQCQPALDIHWGLERTMDVYKETFGLNGCDNHGSPVIALVNDAIAGNAAMTTQLSDGTTLLTFGLGQIDVKRACYPRCEIFTIAHEYTHAVTRKLIGDGKNSRALGESYADIMGKMVERKVLDNDYSYVTLGETVNYCGWKMGMVSGAGSPIQYIRRFDDPSQDLNNDPIYYEGARWNELEREEHHDAGVQNYWFYLLCTGAEDFQPEKGEKVTITAIPRDSAELIAFGAMTYFINADLSYPEARKNSIRSAELYFGKNSQEVKSVFSAWYAVGVGTDEWQPGDPTSLEAINTSNPDNLSNTNGVRKVISNGRIVIMKNGHKYSPSGQLLD